MIATHTRPLSKRQIARLNRTFGRRREAAALSFKQMERAHGPDVEGVFLPDRILSDPAADWGASDEPKTKVSR